MRSKKPCPAAWAVFVTLLAFLSASILAVQPAQAKTKFKVLHKFKGRPKDGQAPEAALVRDGAGNLYGTTISGGWGGRRCGGCGTAFKLNKNSGRVWQHSFRHLEGIGPLGGLLLDKAGTIYGTAEYGGGTKCLPVGCGTLFKLDQTGKETVLYRFNGTPDGQYPNSTLVEDVAGNLYGTTEQGGSSGEGTIFEVDTNGNERVLYSFTGGADGCEPEGVIVDAVGNLYGVAPSGGSGFCANGDGVVFKVDAAGSFSVLYTFNGSDGAFPSSVLILDANGNLYGETGGGGSSMYCASGCGTVKLSSSGKETVLYSFCSLSNCEDGAGPGFGPLVLDTNGNLYGTTLAGGAYPLNCYHDGCGVVFKLSATRTETVLYNFTGGADGGFPEAGLVSDNVGNLYGTTTQGGDLKCNGGNGGQGCGVVFKVTP